VKVGSYFADDKYYIVLEGYLKCLRSTNVGYIICGLIE